MNEVFPRKYGRYRLTGVLGAGGMGVVYRAETEPLAGITRTVAIKTLQPGSADTPLEELIDMLLDEARIWVRLQHPNIVSVVDFGRERGDWFLALELIDGITAQELVDREGKVPVPEALCIVERVARALAYAHSVTGDDKKRLRIVHRDVKPANILLSSRGEVKLTDFGIARATDRRVVTEAGQVRGSLRVMSPEQILGEAVDARSDLFSLGCTLHELLTGRALLAGPRESVLAALSTKQIPPPDPSLPPAVRDLVARLTAAEPAKRPASADEVARQARAMLLPETVEDLQTVLAERVQRLRTVDDDETAPGPSPESGDTTRPRSPAPDTTAPRFANAETAPLPPARETAPLPLGPLGTRPARPWEVPPAPPPKPPDHAPLLPFSLPIPKKWMFHVRVGGAIAAALVATYLGIGWVSCSRAEAELARKRAGAGTISETAEHARDCIRFCRSDPDRRSVIAIASFLGGSSSTDASSALALEAPELRLRAAMTAADARWAPNVAKRQAELLPPSSDSACLASALAFNARTTAGIEIPSEARRTSCGAVLAAAEQTRLGNLDDAFATLEKVETRSALLAYAVALSLQERGYALSAKLEDALRASSGESTGAWIPGSWTRLTGERGRATTPLDDVPSLGWMLEGDVHARAGDFTRAQWFYERAETRGYRGPDLYARLIDLHLHPQLDRRGATTGRSPASVVTSVLILAKKADARLSSVDGLVARVALAHIAAQDAAAAETALAMVQEPELRSMLESNILRVLRNNP